MWIYETIFRDIEWSLHSLEPQKATAFVLMKVSMREEILGGKPASTELPEPEITACDALAESERLKAMLFRLSPYAKG